MLRSMFAGVSGLKAHQMRMDVIGNNIANVNTAGYKASRVTFQEMLSQTTRGATAPTANRGGSNPQQVGLGVQLGSIDVKHTQGNTQSTGYITDLAIEGDGFFILAEGEDGLNRLYTRAGIFGLDSGGTEGNLVSLVNGMRVMGYRAENGIIDYTSLKPLYISGSQTIEARATDQVVFGGNLDSRYTEGTGVRRTVQVYDSLGTEHTIVVDLTKTKEDNTWDWKAYWLVPSSAIPVDQAGEITPNARYVVHEQQAVEG
ncbi:MAG: flagellar hook-basal body complex protein [Limnochordia bacterium]